jgi:hypothetical protein
MGDVDFDTYHHVKFIVTDQWVSMSASPDRGYIMYDVSIKNDDQVVVPYLNPEKSIFYIDIYDLDLNLISRYKLLNTIADIRKEENVSQIMVDNDNNLYAMVISKVDYPKLLKYKRIFD